MNDKILLGDFIYQLHQVHSFYGESTFFSNISACFSGSTKKTISQKIPKLIKGLKQSHILKEDIDDLICVLADWADIAEGIFFTTKAVYVDSPKNAMRRFRVRYDDIVKLKLYSERNVLEITDYDHNVYRITTKLWNIGSIKIFLEFASGHYRYTKKELNIIKDIQLPHLHNQKVSELISGTVYGNVSDAATIYGESKFQGTRGHGFAAERANMLYDKYTGHQVEIVGDNNVKDGADRLVDGVQIQSKYCKTGEKCVSECFRDGKFRYINPDGTPMKIEVPADKYDAAVASMEERIRRGEVQGITEPGEARNIVQKGHFTYEQAKNIAKAGTVESITYDAANGMIIASSAFGISAILSFATAMWNNEGIDTALKNAALCGLKVGGVTFVTAVLAGQLSKAGLNSVLVGSSEAVIKAIGPKGSALLANAFREGNNIFGAAAMKSASKMLRNNVITGAASVVILSTADIVNIFRGRISGGQLLKNVAGTVSSVAGGTAGWVGGATAGAALGSAVPIIGTAVGTLIGGVAGALGGGALASDISDSVMGAFIEDDADEMVKILEESFLELASDYLLTQREVEHVIDHLGESLTGENLKCMYASADRKAYAKALILPYVRKEIKRRKKISTLDQETMQRGLRLLLDEMADSNQSPVFG